MFTVNKYYKGGKFWNFAGVMKYVLIEEFPIYLCFFLAPPDSPK